MNRDPILDTIGVAFHRLTLFIVLSAIQGLVLWLWLLLCRFNVARSDLLFWLRVGWTHESASKLPSVLLYGTLTIGILTTSVVYLLINKWWKKRADVHRRGARFEGRDI